MCDYTEGDQKRIGTVKRECSDQPNILSDLRFRRLSWLGPVGRMTAYRLLKKLLLYEVEMPLNSVAKVGVTLSSLMRIALTHAIVDVLTAKTRSHTRATQDCM